MTKEVDAVKNCVIIQQNCLPQLSVQPLWHTDWPPVHDQCCVRSTAAATLHRHGWPVKWKPLLGENSRLNVRVFTDAVRIHVHIGKWKFTSLNVNLLFENFITLFFFFLNLTTIQFGPEHVIYNHYTTVKCDFLPLSSFRSISACSSSRWAASCCRLTCSTTAETWWGKRRLRTGRLPYRRWRPSTTVGPMATSLTAMGWMLWRLRSTQWNRGPLQDLCFNVPCSLTFSFFFSAVHILFRANRFPVFWDFFVRLKVPCDLGTVKHLFFSLFILVLVKESK